MLDLPISSFTISSVLPRFLAVCNRTLYGEINKTYEIEVPKPGDVPFVCTLNFTALGDEHGDIIQVSP